MPKGNAQIIYDHLRKNVLPHKKVVSYSSVSEATKIPLGKDGGPVAKALDEIFVACDQRFLPPLAVVVVKEDSIYDKTGRHGMPGGGYFVTEALSPHKNKDRQHPPAIRRWAQTPRPKDTESWTMQTMIEDHQDMVWDFPLENWPEEL